MNERIKILRKSLGMTQDDFGKKLGLARNSIANYEIGRRIPTNAVITSICREFNINENWLRYGQEPMNNPMEDRLSTYMAQIAIGEDDFIKDLIEVYMELDQTSKDTLKIIANRMADKKNKRGQK